jgi:Stress responsive A/B Barrel Domain
MIRHIVALRFKTGTATAVKAGLYADLARLSGHIDGILDFQSFLNVSVELPVVRGFNDLFWFDFRDIAVRDAYLADPVHQAIGARIVAELSGGVDGVFVFDVAVP